MVNLEFYAQQVYLSKNKGERKMFLHKQKLKELIPADNVKGHHSGRRKWYEIEIWIYTKEGRVPEMMITWG